MKGEFVMKRNRRAALFGLASSLALTISACNIQTPNASEGYNDSKENIESSQAEQEQSSPVPEAERRYTYLDLYVLNTAKIGAEVPTYYIVTLDGTYNTSIGETAYYCQYKNCYLAEEGLKDKYHCYADVYKTVGLEENQTFYITNHFPLGYYDNYIYLTINDYVFAIEPVGEGNDASETEEFQTFVDVIVPIYLVVNPDDLRYSYTVEDIAELMTRMNSGEYEFSQDYVPILSR